MSVLGEWVENLYLQEAYKRARESLADDHGRIEMGILDMWLRSYQRQLDELLPRIPQDDESFDLSMLKTLWERAAKLNKNDYVIRTARARGIII